MQKEPINVLVLDMGTNDLCTSEVRPTLLVRSTVQFLNLHESQENYPRLKVFESKEETYYYVSYGSQMISF